MLNNLPAENRSEKSSKSKLDFQLPRIQLNPNNNDSLLAAPTALRFHWLTLPRDYSTTPLAEIETEYTQLRRELHALNEQAAKTVERMALRNKPQRPQGTHLIEVRGREAENNNAIIGRLRAELEQLQKRVTVLGETGKDALEDSIQQARQQIVALRHKNKELQQKSKEIGCSIEAGDQAFSELKNLQVECVLVQRKKAKLEARWKETSSNLDKVGRNLSELTGEADQAQTYIEEQLQSSRVDKAERKLESVYRQHNYNLEALKKNEESVSGLKQQKYHQRLKQLEEITTKIQHAEREIDQAGEKYLHQREQIAQLEQKLRESVENSRNGTGVAQEEQQQKQNEKSPQEERFKHTMKVTRSARLPKDGKPQTQSQYGRISCEQEPTKTRLLNLRINKSVNRKADKANHTIDTLPAENARIVKKKISTESKAERQNTTFNKPVALPAINTFEFHQKQSPQKQTITVQPPKPKKVQDYFPEQHIQEEIQESLLKEAEPTGERESDKAIEGMDRAIEGLAKESNPHQKGTELLEDRQLAESHSQQEQEDADLQDFKKSIAAELTGPYTGIGTINIALGEIQNSIRKHESKTRMHQRSKDEPIEQEQQPLE